ncbi:MAG: nuclear transport factor 2 family protein [Chloroflexota bacterium]|jgi:ketosteroid isomerase-like protein|nr:nuclear transport factor 2 family protein [Chloroflexota bacterium]
MNRDGVQAWLDRYIVAWRANDRGPIEELFTEDAVYSYRPWLSDEHTVRGRDAIIASWLEEPDDPGSWEAHYEPYAVDGDRAVAVGWSRYAASDGAPERTYHNAYLLRFAPDGRCAEFREFYFLEGT